MAIRWRQIVGFFHCLFAVNVIVRFSSDLGFYTPIAMRTKEQHFSHIYFPESLGPLD